MALKLAFYTLTNNKNTKVLIICSVILFVISVISVTLTAEYTTDELDMIILVISDSKMNQNQVLLYILHIFWL